MTLIEYIESNSRCAVNNIPFAEFDCVVDECSLEWLDAHTVKCFDGDRRAHNHTFVSLRFSDGKIAGYNFAGGYHPGSSSFKGTIRPIIDWFDLTGEAVADMEIDIDSLI